MFASSARSVPKPEGIPTASIDSSQPALQDLSKSTAPPDSTTPAPDRRITSFRELRALWREDRENHRGSVFTPGFQVLAVHRFGVWMRGLENPVGKSVCKRLYLMVNWFVRSFHGIELPAATHIGRRCGIGHQGGIVVHARAVIGDDCLIRHNVTIGAARKGVGQATPRIGDRVEIGTGAVLIGGITIGDDVVIGANAVVRVDVPANAVVLPPEPTIVIRRSTGRRQPAA